MAVPADWRLVFGHLLPAKWRQFLADWRILLWKIELFRQIGVFFFAGY